jgi:protein O-mannosyl-transferase
VEPVLALVGRADLLATLLLLLASFLTLLDTSHLVLQVIIATAIAAAALLAKETAIVVFVFLAAILLLKSATRQQQNCRKTNLRVIISCACVLCVGLLLASWRHWMGNWTAPRFARGDNPAAAAPQRLTRLLTFNHIYGLNLFLLLCPVWLCFDWALGCVPLVTSLVDARTASIALLWVSTLFVKASAVKSALKYNYLVLSALLLTILPFLLCMNVLVHVGFVLAERSLYLSAAGLCLLVNIGRRRLINTCVRDTSRVTIHLLHTVALAALLGRTLMRSCDWRSPPALYLSGLQVCPRNAKVHYNLAKVLAEEQNQEDLVLLLYKEAVRLGKASLL